MKTIREQDPNRASGLDYAVSTTAQITAQQALNALADGGKTVGGKEIVDPEQASQNLNRALAMVKAKIGDDVEIDLGDIYFQVFDGNVVGESKEDGTFVDPIMLMHPVMRLVHVLAHELAHRKNEIQNEALVEAFVESVFGRSDLEHDYEDGTAMFREFAEKFDKNGDANAGARKIYELYAAEKYEDIFYFFMAGIDENEQDEAFNFFTRVFPELDYVGENPGYFGIREAESRFYLQ